MVYIVTVEKIIVYMIFKYIIDILTINRQMIRIRYNPNETGGQYGDPAWLY